MTALRVASNASSSVARSGVAPAHPKLAIAEAGSSAAPFAVQRSAAANPFASLKQEQTVEAKVSTQLLTLTKGGMAMGGATQAYQVPEELMALAGRRKAELEASQPPARDAAAGVGRAPSLPPAPRLSLAPSLPAASALPSIAVPAPEGSFNWLAVSLIAYALLCVAYWVAPHWG